MRDRASASQSVSQPDGRSAAPCTAVRLRNGEIRSLIVEQGSVPKGSERLRELVISPLSWLAEPYFAPPPLGPGRRFGQINERVISIFQRAQLDTHL